MCQEQPNMFFYETHKTTVSGLMESCNGIPHRCNGSKFGKMLTFNEIVETPVISSCLSVPFLNLKLIICRTGPCILNQQQNINTIWR
jgi:hypothetical protein